MNILATFRNLRNITVRVETLVREDNGVDTRRIDMDRIAAEKDYLHFLVNKEGALIEKMVFVVEGWSILFPEYEEEDGLRSLVQYPRIFHCENVGSGGPVVREETLPYLAAVNTRLWELGAR